MEPHDYKFLADFLKDTSGLILGENKSYLIDSRLTPLSREFGLDGPIAVVSELKKDKQGKLAKAIAEAMTTNETSFFRDRTPFDELKSRLLPELISARKMQRKLRIWCAAGSTGQEPYSILMTLDEAFPELRHWNIELVATDLATEPIRKAKEGIYSQFEVQRGLPIQNLVKHFDQVEAGWQIKEEIRNRVRWEQLNLLESFQHLFTFDIIFCRNVLIYFDTPTKTEILTRMHRQLHPDGFLILGAAETVIGVTEQYKRYSDCRAAVYRPDTFVPASK
ncbi:CheR family methyltransferase [Calycomorphotria hydatis]|uniref:protein-glutamate O-methyltransferase n=1 Tax=Calycomorphotria hydatis TaxID=2528027 RepID=A0A517T7A7_9PLAN|nr:protein-glutamate O-methyltransferase CheR [Calycomorphotria hydatis]QDT64258.1 Chemotaxis protein methyltransferase Cher2 [Calycomorphotria hydatis]